MSERVCVIPLSSPPPPEDAFRLLAREEDAFFLDSAFPMPGMARYSILGCRPYCVMEATGSDMTLRDAAGVRHVKGDPFRELRRLLAADMLPPQTGVPFLGGAVGYLGYGLRRFIERVPNRAVADIPLPDMYLAFHDSAIVYDLHEQRAWAVGCAAGGRSAATAAGEMGEMVRGNAALLRTADCGLRNSEQAVCQNPARAGEIGNCQSEIRNLSAEGAAKADRKSPFVSANDIRCNFTRAEYLRAVQRCLDYIAAGDIFQVNLSRRFVAPCALPPWELYLRLRLISPAPMAAYLDLGEGRAVVSASPERFLALRGSRVETRPIKGTRPRGASAAEDDALARELTASAKDNAELAMIVDLERNDLGRVCSYGSVRVDEARRLESYPTVHHLVATVSGELHYGRDRVDLLRATFPGGSITGAPKVRAMQIIDELEPTARSVYTGAVGYFGFDGAMDLNIVIRTILCAGGKVWLQAGGGIVADSRLEAEYDETTQKARALLAALQTDETAFTAKLARR